MERHSAKTYKMRMGLSLLSIPFTHCLSLLGKKFTHHIIFLLSFHSQSLIVTRIREWPFFGHFFSTLCLSLKHEPCWYLWTTNSWTSYISQLSEVLENPNLPALLQTTMTQQSNPAMNPSSSSGTVNSTRTNSTPEDEQNKILNKLESSVETFRNGNSMKTDVIASILNIQYSGRTLMSWFTKGGDFWLLSHQNPLHSIYPQWVKRTWCCKSSRLSTSNQFCQSELQEKLKETVWQPWTGIRWWWRQTFQKTKTPQKQHALV